MTGLAPDQTIEIVPERPEGVVCRLRGGAGETIGTAFVHEQEVQPIGGRRFWIYRAELMPEARAAEDAILNAAFEALEREYEASRSGPVGVCLIVEDLEEMRRRPEAVWPETKLLYARTLSDGRQLRIRYFWDATIGPGMPDSPSLDSRKHLSGYPVDERYRIVPLAESEEVSEEDVLALWAREDAVRGPDAESRVKQVTLVALERDEGVVGVSSAMTKTVPELRMDFWYYRTFVAAEHRHGHLSAQLFLENQDYLERRFVSGEDARAGGVLIELEGPGIRDYFNRGVWLPGDLTFVGETEGGAHIRVHYFPGAKAPIAART